MKIYKITQTLNPAKMTDAANVLQSTIVPAITALNSIHNKDQTLQQMIANALENGDTKEMEQSMATAVQAIKQVTTALPTLQNSGIDMSIITEAIRGGDIPQLEQVVKGAIQPQTPQ